MRIRSHQYASLLVLAPLLLAGCAQVMSMQKGGFNLISVDEEWSMRDQMKQEVASKYKLATDARALEYLNAIGRGLVAKTELASRQWDFGIVQEASVNAFNLPGGLVYVHAGLLAEADKLDELTAVLGHEIGHGVARHGTQLMSRQVGVQVLTGLVLGQDPGQLQQVLGSLVGSGIIMRYSREAENEADRLGIRNNVAAGYDPQGAVTFFRKLLALQSRSPSKIEQMFASHPLAQDRIAAAEAEIRKMPPPPHPVQDTPQYHEFRRKLGAE